MLSGLGHALTRDDDLDLHFARSVITSREPSPDALEALARRIVRYPGASPDLVAAAAQAAMQARVQRPADVSLTDLWAATQYRQGNLDAAIDIGRALLARQPAPYYAGHLARYLGRRLEVAGPASEGGAEAGDVSLEVPPGVSGETAVVRVRLARATPGLALLALARRTGETIGLLRLDVPKLGPGEHVLRLPLPVPPQAAYDVALVDGACRDCDPGQPAVFWRVGDQASDLP